MAPHDGRAQLPKAIALALTTAASFCALPASAAPTPQSPEAGATAAAEPSPEASPPPEGASPESASPADPASFPAVPEPEPPAPPQLLEVTVEGEKAPPGAASIKRREIREMPGVLGDAYRAIEVQPGVTPTATGLPYYFIRGAPPGNIGYFFDGIQVPLLFHAGAGPSVVPAALVNRVDLHLGPYPARIGRLAGAAVEADSAPPSYTWRGEGGLRSGDVGGVVEGPLNDKVSVLVGGRYAAGAALLSALLPNVDLSYADYQGRASFKLSEDSRISVLTFGSYDYLAAADFGSDVQETNVLLDTDFHRLDVRYEQDAQDGRKFLAAVTLGLDQSRGIGVIRARDYKVGARVKIQRPVASGRALLRAGLDAAVDVYDVTPRPPRCPGGCPASDEEDDPRGQLDEAFADLFPSRTDLALGAWVDALIALDERSSITPGIRVDHYTSLGNTGLAIDPKLVGKFGIGERVRLIPAVGIASQLPGFAPLPALQIGGVRGGLQRSLQTSFGAEVSLFPIEIVGSVFRQATFNLTDPIGTNRGTTLGADRFLTRSLGDAYGLELGARGALRKNIFFLASYTLSRSTRRTEGRVIPSAYDRTHVAHIALLYDLGNNWRAGIRHVLYTGFPADEVSEGREPSEHPDRVHPFYRFDVRLSKRWKLGQTGYVGLVFDLQNATLSKEVFDVSCDDNQCVPRELGPITIPGLALEGGF